MSGCQSLRDDTLRSRARFCDKIYPSSPSGRLLGSVLFGREESPFKNIQGRPVPLREVVLLHRQSREVVMGLPLWSGRSVVRLSDLPALGCSVWKHLFCVRWSARHRSYSRPCRSLDEIGSLLRRPPAVVVPANSEGFLSGDRSVHREVRMTRPAEVSIDTKDTGAEPPTSITVRFDRLAIITAFSSSKATLQTASAGWLSSRTSWPVSTLQTLTRPSLPPLKIRLSSNCRLVTLLSCAARRCIAEFVLSDQTRTEPSEPPAISVSWIQWRNKGVTRTYR
jgi:hypothetical protein